MKTLLRAALSGPPRRGVVALPDVAAGLVGPANNIPDIPDLASSQNDDGLGEIGASRGLSKSEWAAHWDQLDDSLRFNLSVDQARKLLQDDYRGVLAVPVYADRCVAAVLVLDTVRGE